VFLDGQETEIGPRYNRRYGTQPRRAPRFLRSGRAAAAILATPFFGEYSLDPIALQLDIPGVLRLSYLPILLTLFLMSFLDTLGTLVGVGAAGNMLDDKGNFPDIEKPMVVDAVTCMFSGLAGTAHERLQRP
jgi:AGZA family xanthine/uracil permease-like MFS transporter